MRPVTTVPFILAHWELFAALAGVLGLLALTYQYESLQGYTGVEPMEAVRLINDGAYVLDLRPAADYAAGHLSQAQHLDPGAVTAWAAESKRKRERPVLLITGPRPRAGVAAILRKAGYVRLYQLRGGIKAWLGAQLPVQR